MFAQFFKIVPTCFLHTHASTTTMQHVCLVLNLCNLNVTFVLSSTAPNIRKTSPPPHHSKRQPSLLLGAGLLHACSVICFSATSRTRASLISIPRPAPAENLQ